MKDMSRSAAADFLDKLLDDESLSDEFIAKQLTSLTEKGETVEEILGFIDAMRARMIRVKTDVAAIDVCGTGGDKSGTFNISTASAIVLAAGGVPVVKHGNRSASSKCGSADVLEALRIPVQTGADEAVQLLEAKNFVFLFAQKYHPALKRLAVVRKQLGFPTIFNLLGPLLNPADVKRQVIGTFSQANAERLAEVAAQLGYEHVIILTSDDGLDEASLSAPTQLLEIVRGHEPKQYSIAPEEFGLEPAGLEELKEGESAEQNAQIIKDTLRPSVRHSELDSESSKKRNSFDWIPGQARNDSAKQRVVVLNAAIGFYVSGEAGSIAEGVQRATEVIQSGKGADKLQELQS